MTTDPGVTLREKGRPAHSYALAARGLCYVFRTPTPEGIATLDVVLRTLALGDSWLGGIWQAQFRQISMRVFFDDHPKIQKGLRVGTVTFSTATEACTMPLTVSGLGSGQVGLLFGAPSGDVPTIGRPNLCAPGTLLRLDEPDDSAMQMAMFMADGRQFARGKLSPHIPD